MMVFQLTGLGSSSHSLSTTRALSYLSVPSLEFQPWQKCSKFQHGCRILAKNLRLLVQGWQDARSTTDQEEHSCQQPVLIRSQAASYL